MSEVKYNIKPLQEEVLKIFKVFAAICEKHGLRYYAAYGTALGAIRHHGFIPWDDDFDVAMPRSDYNKFVNIVRGALPRELKFFRGGESKYGGISISRIVNVSEGIVDRLREETNLDLPNAPFIDIFVLEAAPTNVFDLKRVLREDKLWRMCQLWRYPETKYSFSRKWLLPIASVLGFFLTGRYRKTTDNEDMMLVRDEIKSHYETSEHVFEPVFFRNRESRLLPRIYFEPSRLVEFEDTQIRVPSKVEELLRIYYGDYMTPPPVEERIPEHVMRKTFSHI